MRKHSLNVCKLRLCLATESTNSARMHTIVAAALQRQYLQMELTFWIPYVKMWYFGWLEDEWLFSQPRNLDFHTWKNSWTNITVHISLRLQLENSYVFSNTFSKNVGWCKDLANKFLVTNNLYEFSIHNKICGD